MTDAAPDDDLDYEEYVAYLATLGPVEFLDHLTELQQELATGAEEEDADHAMLRDRAQADYFHQLITHDFYDKHKKAKFCEDTLFTAIPKNGELAQQVIEDIMILKRENEQDDDPSFAATCNSIIIQSFEPEDTPLWEIAQKENVALVDTLDGDTEIQMHVCGHLLRDSTFNNHPDLNKIQKKWLNCLNAKLNPEPNPDGSKNAPDYRNIIGHCTTVLENSTALDPHLLVRIEAVLNACIMNDAHYSRIIARMQQEQWDAEQDKQDDPLAFLKNDNSDEATQSREDTLDHYNAETQHRYTVKRMGMYDNKRTNPYWTGWLGQYLLVEFTSLLNDPEYGCTIEEAEKYLTASVADGTDAMLDEATFVHEIFCDSERTHVLALQARERAKNPDGENTKIFNSHMAVTLEGTHAVMGDNGTQNKKANLKKYIKGFCATYDQNIINIEGDMADQAAANNQPIDPKKLQDNIDLMEYHQVGLYDAFIKAAVPMLRKNGEEVDQRKAILDKAWLYDTTIKFAGNDSILLSHAHEQFTRVHELCLPAFNRSALEKIAPKDMAKANDPKIYFVRHFDLN